MAAFPHPALTESSPWTVSHEQLDLRTTRPVEFVDLTAEVIDVVRRAGLVHGLVNIQTRHTTTAIVLNENEPLLFEDVEERLARFASERDRYRHDDLHLRTVNVGPDERINGHAHARAVVLGASESVHVVDGALQLGRWQRILFLELDGAQRRSISVVAMGVRGVRSRNGVTSDALGRTEASQPREATQCG